MKKKKWKYNQTSDNLLETGIHLLWLQQRLKTAINENEMQNLSEH